MQMIGLPWYTLMIGCARLSLSSMDSFSLSYWKSAEEVEGGVSGEIASDEAKKCMFLSEFANAQVSFEENISCPSSDETQKGLAVTVADPLS
jgi:hypothetical protein